MTNIQKSSNKSYNPLSDTIPHRRTNTWTPCKPQATVYSPCIYVSTSWLFFHTGFV